MKIKLILSVIGLIIFSSSSSYGQVPEVEEINNVISNGSTKNEPSLSEKEISNEIRENENQKRANPSENEETINEKRIETGKNVILREEEINKFEPKN